MAYLCHSDGLAILAPAGLIEILWKLCCFSTSCLTNDYGDLICLDQVEQTLLVSCNWQQSRWFVQCRDKATREFQLGSHLWKEKTSVEMKGYDLVLPGLDLPSSWEQYLWTA
jgi:hypothetical protein